MNYKRHLPRRQPRRLKGYNYAKAGSYFVTLNCKIRFPFFGEIKDRKMKLNEFGLIVQKEWIRTPEIRPNISLGPFIVMPDHLHGIIIIEKEIKADNFLKAILPHSKAGVVIDKPNPNLLGGNQVGGVLQPPQLDYFGRLQNARDISDLRQNENSSSLQNARDISDLRQNENSSRLQNACDNELELQNVRDNPVLRNPNFRSPSQTLGAILRGFMGTVTSQINHLRNTPGEKIWQRGFHDHIIRNKWSYHRISIYIRNNPKKWKLK